MFCLIFKQVINITHNVINENMVELPSINNSTFVGYLHSRVAVQHFSSIPSRKYTPIPATKIIWYDLSQLGLNFPHAGFFAVPITFLKTKSLGANGLNFTLESYSCLSFC